MLLFIVKKEVFEWIKAGRKTIELRKGIARAGDQAVFQCGRNILRGKIVKKDEGSLATLLQSLNFKHIIPAASSVEEATAYINRLYGSTEECFTACASTSLLSGQLISRIQGPLESFVELLRKSYLNIV
jgi:ASC-1-like (ASCH) protein